MTPPEPATTATTATTGPADRPDPEVRSWSWHIMAVTSWLLLVLLPIHVLSTWVLHDPGHFGVALYVDRWHHGYWRLLDGALVALALVHGGIGLNSVLAGISSRPSTRVAITAVLAVLLTVVGLMAMSTIFTFNLS
jgi:succinate dehydrogenase / fumarate reductase, membrane anchor subunit